MTMPLTRPSGPNLEYVTDIISSSCLPLFSFFFFNVFLLTQHLCFMYVQTRKLSIFILLLGLHNGIDDSG